MSAREAEYARCPTCGKLWSASLSACPGDGASLQDATLLAVAPAPDHDPPTDVIDLASSFSPTHPRRPIAAALAVPALEPTEVVLLPPGVEGPGDSETSALPRRRQQTPIPVSGLDLLPGSVVGEYEVLGKLGEGGMGAVFAAVHPLIGKRVAIKVIARDLAANTESVERFVQEARAVNAIGHEGIVDIFSFGTLPDGRPYLVMEWLQGEPVADRLKVGPMDASDAAHVLDQTCRALEAAHDKGIVHRDLKPDNVFLVEVRGERPKVKLLDFGLAKLNGSSDVRMQRTRSGAIMGTPLYVSPEQARGEKVGAPADVYSLGCMAFEMFAGRPPFDAALAMDVIIAHIQTPPPRASSIRPGIAPELDNLVLRMLAKRPSDRPSLPEIRATLRTFLVGVEVPNAETVPPVAPESPLSPKSLPVARRALRRPALVVGGMVAGLGVAIGFIAWRLRKDASPITRVERFVEDSRNLAQPVGAPIATPAPAPRVTGTLVVTVDSPARIEIDGQIVEASATTARLDVDRVGDHAVVVAAPGRVPVRKTAMVAEGATVVLPVKLAQPVASRAGSRGSAPAVAPSVPTVPIAAAKQASKPKTPPKPVPTDQNSTINPFKRKPAAP